MTETSFYLAGTSVVSHVDGLVQERHNSSALAIELCLSYTNSSMSTFIYLSSESLITLMGVLPTHLYAIV